VIHPRYHYLCAEEPRQGRTEPGEVVRHGLDTALELGRQFGCDRPEEVIVFAIEGADVETFGEELSPPVTAVAEQVLGLVRREAGA
jgi:hypothetical protein